MRNADFRGLALILLALVPVACPCAGDVYTPNEWAELFKKAGGWAPLPFPDSKYRPGSIIQVTDEGIRWIDHLESCGFPSDVLQPEPGRIPAITFKRDRELGADVLVNVKGITAGPEFSKVGKTTLAIQEHGADALRLLKLKIWLESPVNKKLIPPACLQELAKKDVFLVTEAFRVSKGEYTLYDKSGAALKLTAPTIGSLLKLEANVKYSVTTEGKLVIEQPTYFAVRRARRVGDDWQVLGDTSEKEEDSADAKIGEIFLKQSK